MLLKRELVTNYLQNTPPMLLLYYSLNLIQLAKRQAYILNVSPEYK